MSVHLAAFSGIIRHGLRVAMILMGVTILPVGILIHQRSASTI